MADLDVEQLQTLGSSIIKRHQKELDERDAEIKRLQDLLQKKDDVGHCNNCKVLRETLSEFSDFMEQKFNITGFNEMVCEKNHKIDELQNKNTELEIALDKTKLELCSSRNKIFDWKKKARELESRINEDVASPQMPSQQTPFPKKYLGECKSALEEARKWLCQEDETQNWYMATMNLCGFSEALLEHCQHCQCARRPEPSDSGIESIGDPEKESECEKCRSVEEQDQMTTLIVERFVSIVQLYEDITLALRLSKSSSLLWGAGIKAVSTRLCTSGPSNRSLYTRFLEIWDKQTIPSVMAIKDKVLAKARTDSSSTESSSEVPKKAEVSKHLASSIALASDHAPLQQPTLKVKTENGQFPSDSENTEATNSRKRKADNSSEANDQGTSKRTRTDESDTFVIKVEPEPEASTSAPISTTDKHPLLIDPQNLQWMRKDLLNGLRQVDTSREETVHPPSRPSSQGGQVSTGTVTAVAPCAQESCAVQPLPANLQPDQAVQTASLCRLVTACHQPAQIVEWARTTPPNVQPAPPQGAQTTQASATLPTSHIGQNATSRTIQNTSQTLPGHLGQNAAGHTIQNTSQTLPGRMGQNAASHTIQNTSQTLPGRMGQNAASHTIQNTSQTLPGRMGQNAASHTIQNTSQTLPGRMGQNAASHTIQNSSQTLSGLVGQNSNQSLSNSGSYHTGHYSSAMQPPPRSMPYSVPPSTSTIQRQQVPVSTQQQPTGSWQSNVQPQNETRLRSLLHTGSLQQPPMQTPQAYNQVMRKSDQERFEIFVQLINLQKAKIYAERSYMTTPTPEEQQEIHRLAVQRVHDQLRDQVSAQRPPEPQTPGTVTRYQNAFNLKQ